MATRQDREKQQRLNEKHKNILAVLLSREENKYCADCLAKGPRWVSWNLGVLICIRCSGLHRSLGVHISRVKSVNLDTWTTEQMVSFCSRGNGWAKEHFEAKLPADFRRPQNDSSIEYFIRDKYEKKKYISLTPIPLRSIKGLGLTDDDESVSEKSKKKLPKQTMSVNLSAIPRNVRPTSPAVIPRPKSSSQIYKLANSNESTNTVTASHRAATDDLLGLHSKSQPSLSPLVQESVAAPPPPSADLTDDLFGPLSFYNSNKQMTTSSGSNSELLNGIQASNIPDANEQANEDKKMSKDLILSLYSQGTTNPVQTQISSGTSYGMPSTSNLAFQQAGGVQFSQGYQNVNPQGMTYQGHHQQMMVMQQQQMQLQQQMQNISLTGMPQSSTSMGYSMMPQNGQQPISMQNNMGYSMGYAGQPQVAQPGMGQMYGNPPNGGIAMNQGLVQLGSYNGGMVAGMPGAAMAVPIGNMQGTGTAPSWGQSTVPQAAGINSGCTLSTQLWK